MHLSRLLVLLASGCILDDQAPSVEAHLVVTWAVRDVSGAEQPCPDATATVIAQPIDDGGAPAGNAFLSTFLCSDGRDTVELPAGLYSVKLDIDGFSPSLPSGLVDLTTDDGTADFDVYADGGFLTLAWTLVGAKSKQPLTCAAANVTDIDVGLGVATLPCAPGSGTTAAIAAGAEVVTVTARSPLGTEGTSTPIATAVQAANGVTDLGTVTISITGK